MGNGPSSYAAARASRGINSSRGTFAIAASTRSSLMPRGFNCFSTIRWRCAAKSAAVGVCWPQPVVASAAKSRYCATIRIREKDNAALRGCKSSGPCFRTGYLSHRRNGIHVTQAIGQRFHHMRRKVRRLLNEKMKPASVDLHQPRGGLRHGIGRARTVIDQRHLAKQRAWAGGLEHKITEENIHFTFQ